MKYFIVADVHGFYDELMKSLDEKGFEKDNPDHTFISLGDLLDRGRKPLECLKFVNSLERKILIRGNHEDLLEDLLKRKQFLQHDVQNGTANTVFDLTSLTDYCDWWGTKVFDDVANNADLKKYLSSVVDYAEVGDNIFVHGWIPCGTGTKYYNPSSYKKIEDWKGGNWNRARWYNGMEAWSKGIKLDGKTIFCGHWHTSFGHAKFEGDGVEFPNLRSTNPEHRRANFDPFIADGIVAMDGCTAYTRKVNCYVLED